MKQTDNLEAKAEAWLESHPNVAYWAKHRSRINIEMLAAFARSLAPSGAVVEAVIEVGDILTPKSHYVACQFPKGERFIVTKVDGEKFHISQFDATTHGYWWKETRTISSSIIGSIPKPLPPSPQWSRPLMNTCWTSANTSKPFCANEQAN